MKRTIGVIAAAAAAGLVSIPAQAATLEDVQAAGVLRCGINSGLAGFSFVSDDGDWQGFDVALCKATAAAVLGDAGAVEYVTTSPTTRFEKLKSGEIDMLSRNTTWTFSRDADLGLTFVGVNYYDGQGFIGRKALGVESATELEGASVCIQTGTTTELNLADFARVNNLSYEPVPVDSNEEARTNYLAERCDVYTTDASGLAANRATFENPDDHVVYPEIISKEPLGPLVRQGDDAWADIVRWTLNAMIIGEELGVSSANVDDQRANAGSPEIARMLGTEGNLHEAVGLSQDWAYNVLKQVGNYGEVFDTFLGPDTAIGLERGLNALWNDGGLLYAPPFR